MASWDRQKDEPPKAFARFTIYRDLGPDRTLAKVGKIADVSAACCEQESAKWNWVSRCDQWDAHLDQIARKAYVTELEKQARQRAQGHSALFGKALQLLAKVDGARLGEVAAAMKVATDAMRLEADLATAKIKVEDVTPLTDEQRLDRLADLVRQAEARAGASADDARRAGGSRPAAPAVHN